MLYIASDYAGYTIKERIKKILQDMRVPFVDLGSNSGNTINDFTDFIKPVVRPVQTSSSNGGILICGTGQGMAIGANRFKKIRAALVHTARQAKFARTHDNANILVIAAWEISISKILPIVSTWMRTRFSPVPRRVKRLKKIDTWQR